MGKIKIYEIAKEFGLANKDVSEVAKSLKIEAKSHLSGVSEEESKKIKDKLTEIKKKNNKNNSKKEGSKIEEKAPVIIRREVIVNEEDKAREKKDKQRQAEVKRNNNVGFVERKKETKDLNIVYRNKVSKPMTVSELFGLNKGTKKEGKESEEVKAQEPKKEIKAQEKNVVEKSEVKTTVENKKENREMKETKENKVERKFENKNDSVNRENRSNNGYNNNRNNYRNNNENRQNNNGNRNFNNENRNNRNNRTANGYNNRNNYNRNFVDNNRPTNGYNRNSNSNTENRFNNNANRNSNNGNNGERRPFQNRNNNNGGYNNRGYNNRGNFQGRGNNNRGVEKEIQEIVSLDIVERENVRDYSSKTFDKQKSSVKFDENKRKSKNKNQNNNASYDQGKIKTLKQTDRLSKMFDGQEGEMYDYYDLTTQRGRKSKKKNSRNEKEKTRQKIFKLTDITIPETITVKDLAAEMKKTAGEVIKKLFGLGIMATINNEIDFDTAFLIAQEFGINVTKKVIVTEEDVLFDDSEDEEEELKERPPVVVVMGHVDHGKTSLLDVIRKTNVIGGEAGGITQAIGAYKVKIDGREITFLDTPGHEAFTSMRARGAKVTDIAILVVAANDGVMPQTIEAINHAKSAEIPIIVAVNKIDLPDANIDKVKQELMAHELVSEEWGGDTIFVPISAKNNQNIEQLLEMVLLQADVLELKANPKKQAKGTVIEARLDKTKGSVATMLVQRGSLDVGDTVVVGSSIGRIRVMTDDKGKKVKTAGPSTPVEITGLADVPQAGDTFYEVKNEKIAKHLIEKRKNRAREKAINSGTKITLDNLFSQMEEGNLKQLNLIIKGDVQGSVEAVKQSLQKLKNEEVKVKVIHAATGAVNQSDVTLAKVSGAIIIAFNVRPDVTAKELAEKDEVEIKQYSIIYKAIEDVEAALKGMLEPKFEEKVIGNAEIRAIFKISNVGTIAGCFILSGKVERNAGVRIVRDNVVIHEGTIATLKREKDDVKEVSKGFECGIQIKDYNDIKEGDTMEAFIMEEIKR